MRLTLRILTTAALALASDDWTTFGAKPARHVSVAAASGNLLGLTRRDVLETAVEANRTLYDCDTADIVKCEDSIGDGCCSKGSECCGGLGCCDAGFKCGLPDLGLCCRADQDVCGGNGCYSEADGETCCGDFDVCGKGEECCGIVCCGGGKRCHQGICTDPEDVEVEGDEDECCAAGGCCPAGSRCHRRECVPGGVPGGAGRPAGLGVEVAGLVVGLVLWVL